MHRRTSTLFCLVLVVMSFAATGSAQTTPGCPLGRCVYLPLVATTGDVFVETSSVAAVTYLSRAVVGWIRNVSDRPVTDVRLEARVYNAAGRLVHTAQGSPAFPVILPGTRSPLDIGGFISETTSEQHTVSVSVVDARPSADLRYRPVKVVSHQRTELGFEVSGVIQNTESRTMTGIRVVAARSDGYYSMAVLDPHDERVTTTTLQPGRSARFSASFSRFTAVGMDYTVLAQGVLAP